MPLDVLNHRRFAIEIVHRDIEEALDLTCMQIHSDDVVASGDCEHVGHQLGGDWGTRAVLLIHAGVRKARNDRCNTPCAGALAGLNENEQLHEVIVHIPASGLEDEDVSIPD
jgi:hypothetical protein